MTDFKLKIGTPVVFVYNGKHKIGKIETVEGEKKSLKYTIRDDAGKLHQAIGVATKTPGYIRVDLSKKYFVGKEDLVNSIKIKTYIIDYSEHNDNNKVTDDGATEA